MPFEKKHFAAIIIIVIIITLTIYFCLNKEEKTEKFTTAPTEQQLKNNSVLYTDENGNLSTWSFEQLMNNIDGSNNNAIAALQSADSDIQKNINDQLTFSIIPLATIPYIYIKGPEDPLVITENQPLKILDGGQTDDDSKKCVNKLSKHLFFNESNQVLKIPPVFWSAPFRIKFSASVEFANNPTITLIINKKRGSTITEINRRKFKSDHNYILYTEVSAFDYLLESDEIYFEVLSNKSNCLVSNIDIMVERLSTELPQGL